MILVKVLHGEVLRLLDYAVPLSIVAHHHRAAHKLLVARSSDTEALPSSTVWPAALRPGWLRQTALIEVWH